MAHDVLISYSSRDKQKADAICNRLESRDIRCWIAPRDVGLGEYAEKIVEAIEDARVMVLIYSANADQSHQVRREVERAVSKGTTIVPVRIEDHEMSKAFELYVGSMHWLDAITPPLEEHIDRLADQLLALLGTEADAPPKVEEPVTSALPAEAAPEAPLTAEAPAEAAQASWPEGMPPVATQPIKGGRGKLVIGLVVLAVVAVALLAYLMAGSEDVSPVEPGAPAQPAGPEKASGAGSSGSAEPTEAPLVDITFENTTAVPVLVNWVDLEGAEENYASLGPGESWTAESYEGHVWVVRAAEAEGALEIVECEVGPAGGDCVVELVTGHTVNYVLFDAGDYESAYAQTSAGTWVEEGGSGEVRFEYVELDRDDWSVYLYDESRDVDIQLDTWTYKVLYEDANEPQRELYDIIDVADD